MKKKVEVSTEKNLLRIKQKANLDEKKVCLLKRRVAELKKIAKEKNISLDEIDQDVFPLSDEEKRQVTEWRERLSKSPQSPVIFTYTVDADGNQIGSMESVTKYPLSDVDRFELWSASLNSATGASNHQLGYALFEQCSLASGTLKDAKTRGVNLTAILNALQALKPQDEMEGMLLSRLISLHFQSMDYLSRTSNEGQTTQGIDININRSTKLMRLYNETLEALMKYRRRGEQKVIVTHQHVQINDNGQAIVGSILNNSGEK